MVTTKKDIAFWKMQGTGNDYVCIDALASDTKDVQSFIAAAKIICDRHFGIGADGLLLVTKSKTAAVRMIIINADGSEAEMCGNGLRCFARFVYENNLTDTSEFVVDTKGGAKAVKIIFYESGEIATVKINTGRPDLRLKSLPAKIDNHTDGKNLIAATLWLGGFEVQATLLSLGNPHVVIFVDDLKTLDIKTIGSAIENDPAFPQRTNIEFVRVISENRLEQRTWERGVGETLSCGTGAVAAVVAGVLTGRCAVKTKVTLLGGELEVFWPKVDEDTWLTGPAVTTFKGVWPLWGSMA